MEKRYHNGQYESKAFAEHQAEIIRKVGHKVEIVEKTVYDLYIIQEEDDD